jgi:hypothetical protein
MGRRYRIGAVEGESNWRRNATKKQPSAAYFRLPVILIAVPPYARRALRASSATHIGLKAGSRDRRRDDADGPLDTLRQTCQFEAMAKFRSSYVCQNCGAITQRWQGKCESCGEWNTIIEEAAALGVGGTVARRGAMGRPFFRLKICPGRPSLTRASSLASPNSIAWRGEDSCPAQRTTP